MRGIRDAYRKKPLDEDASREQKIAYDQTLTELRDEEQEAPDYLPLNFNTLVKYFCICNQRKKNESKIDHAVIYINIYIYIYKEPYLFYLKLENPIKNIIKYIKYFLICMENCI